MAYLIATFTTRNGTMNYFNNLKYQGISCSLMNTPGDVSGGCGLCVKFNEADLESAQLATKSMKTFSGLYLVNKVNNKQIITRV